MFGAGIAAADITVSRSGNHLVVNINDPANPTATDRITVENWYESDYYRIEQAQFADGNSLNAAQLSVLGNAIYGTEGADILTGFVEDNTLYGLGGDDSITDTGGNNTIYGRDGNDTLTGGAGSDTLDDGLGADTMAGGAGNDSYVSIAVTVQTLS